VASSSLCRQTRVAWCFQRRRDGPSDRPSSGRIRRLFGLVDSYFRRTPPASRVGSVDTVTHTWTERLISGTVPPIRFIAPVAIISYVTLMGTGPVTLVDWLFVVLCGLFALFGGRFPLAAALSQSALVAAFELLHEPVAAVGGSLLSGGSVNASTAGPIHVMATLALIELAARRPLRFSLLAGLVAIGVEVGIPRSDGADLDLLTTGYHLTVTVVAPILLGAYLRATLRTYRQAKVAAATADERRHEAERTARLTERTDVAREIHDLVAHHVASIALRTAVARDLMPNIDQDEVAAVLDDVHTTATTALDDLRKLVTVLRDPRTVDPALPAQFGPGLLDPIDLPQALRDSLDRAVGSGLTVNDQIDPAVAGLDAVRALAVLRTVQEGLTNVAKHVGSGTDADVRVHISGEYVEMRITDTGRSFSASPADRDHTPHTEPGHGLVGLSERLNMLGGSLTVGPTGSGWTLAATLPTAWNTAEPVGGDTGQFAEHSR